MLSVGVATTRPFTGVSRATIGTCVSTSTVSVALALPQTFDAVSWSVRVPSPMRSSAAMRKTPPSSVAATPFTVTVVALSASTATGIERSEERAAAGSRAAPWAGGSCRAFRHGREASASDATAVIAGGCVDERSSVAVNAPFAPTETVWPLSVRRQALCVLRDT
jgi:hypothetical protein